MYRETGGRRPLKSLIYEVKTDLLLSRVRIKAEVQQSLKEKSQTIKNPKKNRHSTETQVQHTQKRPWYVEPWVIHNSTKNRKGERKAFRLLYRRKGRFTGETNQGGANTVEGERNRNMKYTCNREKSQLEHQI